MGISNKGLGKEVGSSNKSQFLGGEYGNSRQGSEFFVNLLAVPRIPETKSGGRGINKNGKETKRVESLRKKKAYRAPDQKKGRCGKPK